MSAENISAALLGGLASSLRYTNKGYIKFFQIFLSSVLLAYFVGPEVVKLIREYTGFAVSVGAVYFLVSYFGSELLERVTVAIKSIQVTRKWK